LIELYPGSREYLYEGYNGVTDTDYEEQARTGFGEFGYLEQGYYDLGDDYEEPYIDEEELLKEFYGEYYANEDYLKDGITREQLIEDVFEYLDYNYNGYNGYAGYYGEYYGFASQEDYEAYQKNLEEMDNLGKTKPEHSIDKPVKIKRQDGPKCSAYASSCLLGYYGREEEPDKLYKEFLKLPDGSAIPTSVGRKIGAKIHTHGKITDLEKMIDAGKPVLVLVFYDEEPDWDNLHYVLVTGYDDENIYIADSLHATGERYYNRVLKKKTFKKMWNTAKTLPVKMFYGKNIYYEYAKKEI